MDSFDWDRRYRARSDPEPFLQQELLVRLAAPTETDVTWILEGLKDERKWFVATTFYRAARIQWLLTRPTKEQANHVVSDCYRGPAFSEIFFKPLMDAGIDECEPSGCKRFVVPCSSVFGVARSLEFLYHVIEGEGIRRKAGAFWATYYTWSGGLAAPLLPVDVKRLREREQELALKAFLGSEDRCLRFASFYCLEMHLDWYPERLRALARRFIQVALESKDRDMRPLIRQKVERVPA
jgi:hypothetical protein